MKEQENKIEKLTVEEVNKIVFKTGRRNTFYDNIINNIIDLQPGEGIRVTVNHGKIVNLRSALYARLSNYKEIKVRFKTLNNILIIKKL